MDSSNSSPVLIIGAGPTGLVLALWLTHLGIKVRIIDKNSEPGKESRAIGIQARTLELYQQMGLAQEIIHQGIKVNDFTLRKNGNKTFSLPLKDMGKGSSPFPFVLFFPQDDHEKILIEHLRLAGITVERNTELVKVTQTHDAVTATLKTSHGTETLSTHYVCGCDGARSTVREQLNISFPGGTYSQIFYVADAIATNDSPDDDIQICVSEEDFCIAMPVRQHGSYRLIGIVPPNKETQPEIHFDDVLPSIARNTHLKIKSLNWFSTYHVHHRIADHFQQGRLFLLGDAAHIHSPAGAQGMNTGIGDSINLAWKLAAVLKNNANPTLLDSYQIERRKFANQLVSTTDKLFQIMTNKKLIGKIWRGFVFPLVMPMLFHIPLMKHVFFKLVSQIKINYRHSPISQGHAGKIYAGDRLPWVPYENTDNFAPLQSLDWQIHIYGAANPTQIKNLKELNLALHLFPWNKAAAAAGLEENTIYLIRPDGYIAYINNDGDADLVKKYLATVYNYHH